MMPVVWAVCQQASRNPFPMPNKQIAVYVPIELDAALRALGFHHGWPQRVLLPVLSAAEKYFIEHSITSYDPGNELLFTTFLQSVLTRRPDSKPAAKAKRGGQVNRRAKGVGKNIQDPVDESGGPVREARAGRDGDEKGSDEK